MTRVLIYHEHHEIIVTASKDCYPEGIHETLKRFLADDEIQIKTVITKDAETITEDLLAETDVMIWWAHAYHNLVSDEVAARVHRAVLDGMGIIFLHSAHFAKPFRMLMGTSCRLNWREDGDRELLWVVNPAHPIAQGIGRFIKLDHEETYGEPFGIPEPDELVFIGSFEGGEVFRSGCCYRRENGKIFYFQPGHETNPTYYHPEIIRVLKNAIHWAKPIYRKRIECPNVKKPLEE